MNNSSKIPAVSVRTPPGYRRLKNGEGFAKGDLWLDKGACAWFVVYRGGATVSNGWVVIRKKEKSKLNKEFYSQSDAFWAKQ